MASSRFSLGPWVFFQVRGPRYLPVRELQNGPEQAGGVRGLLPFRHCQQAGQGFEKGFERHPVLASHGQRGLAT